MPNICGVQEVRLIRIAAPKTCLCQEKEKNYPKTDSQNKKITKYRKYFYKNIYI